MKCFSFGKVTLDFLSRIMGLGYYVTVIIQQQNPIIKVVNMLWSAKCPTNHPLTGRSPNWSQSS